jgi:hypothetical protein
MYLPAQRNCLEARNKGKKQETRIEIQKAMRNPDP